MKPIWSGSLSFGLVTIPIRVYSAIQTHTFGFHILHKLCSTPLEYERWCPHCKKEVTWENTIRGLKQPDGSYLVFTKEMLENYKPEKSDTLTIISFVDKNQIEPIYIENHFFVGPDKKGINPFSLFQKALLRSGKIAVCTFVMKEKEYICSLQPYKSAFLLNTLYYDYEVRSATDIIELKKIPTYTQKEISLALQLIDQLTEKTFTMSKYKDQFVEKLKKAITTKKKTKASKKQLISTKKPIKKETLTAILQKSIHEHKRPAYAKNKRR